MIGRTLKNGAVVVDCAPAKNDKYKVIAVRDGAVHKYVVWYVFEEDNELYAIKGTYCDSYDEAKTAYSGY